MDLEIREQIAKYTNGEVEAAELADWLELASWDSDSELAATALRLLAEQEHGDWTAAEIRERLGALSRAYRFEQAPNTAFSGSASQVIRQDQRSATADRWRVAESV
jgi:hypothetical protein